MDGIMCIWCGTLNPPPDTKEADKGIAEVATMPTENIDSSARWALIHKLDKCIEEINKIVFPKCNYCGESLSEVSVMNDTQFKAYGQKLYEEYKTFVGDDSSILPEQIEIRIDRNLSAGECDYDEKKQIFFVAMNPVRQIYKHNLPDLFYHEFRHLHDLHDPTTGTKKKDSEKTVWLSEYNACAVEMKKMLGYEHINEDKDISLSDIVIYNNQKMTAEEHLKAYLENEVKRINKYKYLNYASLLDLVRFVVYYLGKISVFKTHIDKDLFKRISNIDDLEKGFVSAAEFSSNDPLMSLKVLEDYDFNAEEKANELSSYKIVGDIFSWFGNHIPDFESGTVKNPAYELEQPYLSDEPKVGRNDPCPCGSGKKHKNCCG